MEWKEKSQGTHDEPEWNHEANRMEEEVSEKAGPRMKTT